jgi:hypothetical protein
MISGAPRNSCRDELRAQRRYMVPGDDDRANLLGDRQATTARILVDVLADVRRRRARRGVSPLRSVIRVIMASIIRGPRSARYRQ